MCGGESEWGSDLTLSCFGIVGYGSFWVLFYFCCEDMKERVVVDWGFWLKLFAHFYLVFQDPIFFFFFF